MTSAAPAVEPTPRARPACRRIVVRWVRLLAVLIACYWGLAACSQRAMLYPAQFRPAVPALRLPERARVLSVTHEQGQTHAYFYLGLGVSPTQPGPAVLYSHGNAELIEDYAGGLPGWNIRGVSVLITEYRGCGNSDGNPTLDTITADHVAFYDLLAQQPEVDPDRIVLHGRSMGGGIVAELARQRPGAALILESTYTSIADFAKQLLVPSVFVKDNWDVTQTLRQYPGPVVLQLSPTDEIMPQWMLDKNRDASPQALILTYDVSHHAPMPDVFYEDAAQHLRQLGVLPSQNAGLQSPFPTNHP